MNPEQVMMDTLRFALSMRRPYGSAQEGRLLASLLKPSLADRSHIDPAGNLHIDLRLRHRGKNANRTLFVAHVDTVHRKPGLNAYDDSTPMWKAMLDQPLGADDGAGVAMLAGLIAAKVPAYYVFTRGEEKGGIGSTYIAEHDPSLLMEFDRAIAFDRKDVFSVITHQGMGRCCSDVFAESLSSELNVRGMLYMPDDTGIYTDTAEFTHVIPECTNVSVGYYGEHTSKERLDTEHLIALFRAACTIKWDKLPTERDPFSPDEDDWMDAAETAAEKEFHEYMLRMNQSDEDKLRDPFFVDEYPKRIPTKN